MSDVTWRRHPVHTHYEASSDGRIRSVDHDTLRRNQHGWYTVTYRGRELRLSPMNKRGYLGFHTGDKRTRAVHRFVCEAFHGMPPAPGYEVLHVNGDCADNRSANLRWGTAAENQQDRVRHGRHHEANKTHCPSGHEYTEANTYRPPSSPTERVCRACRRHQRLTRRLAINGR